MLVVLFNLLSLSLPKLQLLPCPGSIYEKIINIPLVGQQIIETEVLSENNAYVKLDGLIKNEGSIKYKENNNKFIKSLNSERSYIIKPSNNLRKIIKKYKIEITSLNYDYEKDCIIFNLYVKLFNYKTCITMNRIN